MYSPKLREEFIPCLFRLAKKEGIPMTKLVNRIIEEALRNERAEEIVKDLLRRRGRYAQRQEQEEENTIK
jgi:hypothetical protein